MSKTIYQNNYYHSLYSNGNRTSPKETQYILNIFQGAVMNQSVEKLKMNEEKDQEVFKKKMVD